PCLQFAVGDGLPNVGFGGPGGDGPVHSAHVVTRVVSTRLPWFGAGAGHEPEVVALQQSVQPPSHGELQRPQGDVQARRVQRGRCPRRPRRRLVGGCPCRRGCVAPHWCWFVVIGAWPYDTGWGAFWGRADT